MQNCQLGSLNACPKEALQIKETKNSDGKPTSVHGAFGGTVDAMDISNGGAGGKAKRNCLYTAMVFLQKLKDEVPALQPILSKSFVPPNFVKFYCSDEPQAWEECGSSDGRARSTIERLIQEENSRERDNAPLIPFTVDAKENGVTVTGGLDTMGHVGKGVIGLFLSAVVGFRGSGICIHGLSNSGAGGEQRTPVGLVTDSPSAKAKSPAPTASATATATSTNTAEALPSSSDNEYYDNASSRGVVLAASNNVAITDLEVSCIRSNEAEAIGIDIRTGSSDVALRRWSVKTVSSGAAAAGASQKAAGASQVTPVGQVAIEVAPGLADISLGPYQNLTFRSAKC